MFMAPGATVAFDGCEVGKGQPGKEFLGAAARLFFGKKGTDQFSKHGFVKANEEEVQLSIVKHEGMEVRSPVVYKWPDDF
jgi:hypothetical protein